MIEEIRREIETLVEIMWQAKNLQNQLNKWVELKNLCGIMDGVQSAIHQKIKEKEIKLIEYRKKMELWEWEEKKESSIRI